MTPTISPARAVLFDVDFTLIYPGPTFQGEGYERFSAKHGIAVDRETFDAAVSRASFLLDEVREHTYDPQLFIRYTRRIIEEMGGSGPGLDACASEIYREWASCEHFALYDDVEPALRSLAASGIRLGLVSNSHRSLEAFEQHFELHDLVAVSVSSSEHGYMKPHPSIFQAALRGLGVTAPDTVMVGDSPRQDIEGARAVGMRAVLLRRSESAAIWPEDLYAGIGEVPVIHSLRELPALLSG